MNLIIISITAVAVTQCIKIIWFYSSANFRDRHSFSWPSFWIGGFPSSHTAALTSVLYAIWKYDGMNLLFGFGVVIALLFIYGLLEDKKRQLLFNEYFIKSGDSSLQQVVVEGRLLSFSGHSIFEIMSGGLIGIFVSMMVLTWLR